MAVQAVAPEQSSPTSAAPVPDVRRETGGASGRLLRFAIANITRRPERFALSTAGIALAITAVIVVRMISIGFAGSGSASLEYVLRGAPLWVVPAEGVHYDTQLGAILAGGPAPGLKVPAGWQAHREIGGVWNSPAGTLVLYGRDDVPTGQALLGSAAASTLNAASGGTVRVGGRSLSVAIAGDGKSVTVNAALATQVVGDSGWWTVTPPAEETDRKDLGTLLAAASGLPSSTDPATTPRTNGQGLIYDTKGGPSALTFEQRFSALFAGKVTASTLGLVSTIGLVLGFVIAVSSFLAEVQERRREFGIMSSIGLADEVLYFFLVESGVVFLVAYLGGALLAGAAAAVVVPGMTSVGDWLQASAMVAAYLPAMAIVGALVPVHRLLQQRPVSLLADQP